MIVIGSWNVRGINNPRKQIAVKKWVSKNNLEIYGILEPRIVNNNLAHVQGKLGIPGWEFASNIRNEGQCRILVSWNAKSLRMNQIHYDDQWVTCEATCARTNDDVSITFVYGLHTHAERRQLWHYLTGISNFKAHSPWIVMGDFNAVLNPSDRQGGALNWSQHHEDFRNAICTSGILQPPYRGIHLTWDNGQHGSNLIMRKLDWVFVNPSLMSKWPNARAHYATRDISDHSAITLSLKATAPRRKGQFKFLNLWVDQPNFMDLIQENWWNQAHGNPMQRLSANLKRVKALCSENFVRRCEIANKPFIDEDIKQAIFSIPDNKSPGSEMVSQVAFSSGHGGSQGPSFTLKL
ncbi:hypothetical protein OIU78_008031 [Salix suchowensis]|nr:hypothetical protein OIU78_008031 [Salix suchowensis]